MAIGIGKNSGTVRLQLNHAQATVISVSYLTALLKLMGDRHHRAELFYHNYPTYQTPQTATRNVEKLAYNPNYNQTNPKPQPNPKTQPKKQPPDVVVHAKSHYNNQRKKI